MRANRIDYSEARQISDETFQEWTRRLTPAAGDLLFAREAPVGPVVRVPETPKIAPGQRTVLLRPNPLLIDSDYLFYLLTSRLQQARLIQKAEGSTVPHLNVSDVRSFKLPQLPSLDTQREISATLRVLDDKIESNQRAVVLGESLIRSFVQQALDESEGELGTLGEYCDLVKKTVKVEDIDESANYIGFEHMPRGSIFLNSWTSAAGLGSHKAAFSPGDVLFGKLRPYFKKVGIAPVAGICSTDILVLRAKDPRDRLLVASVAASDSLIDALTAASTGTRMPRASWKDLAAWPVPVLSNKERETLAAIVAPIHERLEHLTLESISLAELRDTLIPALLSGRICVPVEGAAA